MHCIIAFICRILLLTVYVVLGRYEHEAVPLDTFERAVVTCMQVCLLAAAWVVYEVCAFVIVVLSGRVHYAAIKKTAPPAKHDDASATPPTDTRRAKAKTADTPLADAAQKTPLDTAAPADHDGAPDDQRVIFDSPLALGRYVARVHVIGVVVWTTMLSIDYALSQPSFSFVLGMLLGNVAWVLCGPPGRSGMPLPVITVYWTLTCALIVLYIVQDGASALAETESELGMTPNHFEWANAFVALSVILSPASCGFSWTSWMDARAVLAHYHTSLYTSVMLSVPVLIFVRGTYLSEILSRFSAPWLAHVIVSEPVLKFMTIYVMTLSLDAENVVEMLTVNASVVGVCYLCFEPHDNTFSATVGVLVACLLSLHITRLSRRALRERRMSRQPAFVIGEDTPLDDDLQISCVDDDLDIQARN